jgi:hypothetical protein
MSLRRIEPLRARVSRYPKSSIRLLHTHADFLAPMPEAAEPSGAGERNRSQPRKRVCLDENLSWSWMVRLPPAPIRRVHLQSQTRAAPHSPDAGQR